MTVDADRKPGRYDFAIEANMCAAGGVHHRVGVQFQEETLQKAAC